MDDEYLIELINVSKTFPGVKALSNVNLSIKPGEVHSVAGENGAGKSTLIKILSGVYAPDPDSAIRISGKTFARLTPTEAVDLGIAVTYQDFSLFPNLTVMENVGISQEIERGKAHVRWKTMRRNAQEAMDKIGLDVNVDAVLGSLSTAKQQMVAIARAINFDAKVVILDEPTSTLSKKEIESLYGVVRTLKNSGTAVLLITHKIEEMFDLSDRITVLRDGQCCGTFKREQLDRTKLISLMVGRKVGDKQRGEHMNSDEVVLEVNHLSKKGNYKDISFKLHRGEILGVSGLVGSGRTELCETLFGIIKPDQGEICIAGKSVKLKNTSDAIRHEIALVPENRLTQGVILRKTVEENATIAVLNRLRNPLRLIKREERKRLAKKWIDDLRIKPGIPEMTASKLSGGNAQRLVIAKWLMMNPKILMIDEPTNGIDVGAKQEIHALLQDLASQGMSIIMVSSELPEILEVSHTVMVMKHGRVTGMLDTDKATQESIMALSV